MKKPLHIIVGSVMGTAVGVAEYLQSKLSEEFDVGINRSPCLQDLTAQTAGLTLFCVSNTGEGELPESVIPLYESIKSGDVDLSHCRYLFINLGDSGFMTFGKSGEMFEQALIACGAVNLDERLLIDARRQRYPKKTAYEWISDKLP